jgi:hypothetical protein
MKIPMHCFAVSTRFFRAQKSSSVLISWHLVSISNEATMSYQHMFYGVDLGRLKKLYGSGDKAFAEELLKAQAESLADNDGFFEDGISGGNYPNSETAVREIIAGKPKQNDAAAMYGYVLKIICEHIGQPIGEDVAAIRDHPYKSQLVASGPPIPIPYDLADFPEIGYLSLADIPAEMKRIDSAPKKAKKSLLLTLLSAISGGVIGRQMDDDDVVEDMNAYRATLQEALDKKVSIVSFRH